MFRSLLPLLSMLAITAHADGKHSHDFPADVEAFHAVLSPLWHASSAAERTAAICKAAPELVQLAGAIQSRDSKALKASATTLQQQCAKTPADIEPSFKALHDAFHQLSDHSH